MKKSILTVGLLALVTLPVAASIGFASLNPIEAHATGGSGYAPYQIVNGGFETGNLTGWRTFSLWKNETGVVAFHDNGDNNSRELVTSTGYFSSNFPYNRDGNYNLGVTYESNTNWSQNDEHMGYLRSGDFTLGGSGWVSFKLGGGRCADFAYVSIRQVSDDTEVARFGNRFFRNTTQATAEYGSTISNAEAFLFQYFYKLSDVVSLGTKLYITLAMTSGDSAGNSWSILSADSFVTYYADAPTVPDNNYLATNIVPTITYASTPLTQIPGGYFSSDDDFNKWSNVDGTWVRDGSRARSNKNGNGDLNVLRSQAFKTSTYPYLRFGWGGGMNYDKQIFLSIKEVNTNIEQIRITPRTGLNGKQSNDLDNHMVDLTGLSTSKGYYLEFADNCTTDWGISEIGSVRLIDKKEWDDVVVPYPGDKANVITGIPTSFDYSDQHEAICWSQHFLDVTGTYCSDLKGGDMATDGKWSGLATDYGTLTSSAMGDFKTIPSDSTQSPTNILLHNPPILPAATRYQFLIGKYSSLHSNNFMVDSQGHTVFSRVSDIPSGFIDSSLDPTALVVGSIAFAGIASAILFFFHKRSKRA